MFKRRDRILPAGNGSEFSGRPCAVGTGSLAEVTVGRRLLRPCQTGDVHRTDQDPKKRRREVLPRSGKGIDAADEEKRKREINERPKLTARIASTADRGATGSVRPLRTGREVGPYEQRVRISSSRSVSGWSAAECVRKVEAVHVPGGQGVLSRAMSDTPPPVPAEIPGDLLTPEHVREIVDSWEKGEQIDVSAMSVTLRTACRLRSTGDERQSFRRRRMTLLETPDA